MTRLPVNLALQGGGAHGAFTWGALDRLLDDEDIVFEGVTATSAGAMNAAMLVTGLREGGRAGAKARLETFWRRIASNGLTPPSVFALFGMTAPPPDAMRAFYEASPAHLIGDAVTRMFSPYQFNPFNVNPLRDLLEDLIDFQVVCDDEWPKVFVNATNVRSGRAKIFRGSEITVDALLASACLPFLFQTVEIDGEGYWDGGYMGNPALWPLFDTCTTRDIMVVHINPVERPAIPRTATEIMNRVNEISFNASLMREMRAINFVRGLVDQSLIDEGRWKRMRVHSVRDDAVMRALGVATKLAPDWGVITTLRKAGHRAADRWIDAHKSRIGVESSVDIAAEFL